MGGRPAPLGHATFVASPGMLACSPARSLASLRGWLAGAGGKSKWQAAVSKLGRWRGLKRAVAPWLRIRPGRQTRSLQARLGSARGGAGAGSGRSDAVCVSFRFGVPVIRPASKLLGLGPAGPAGVPVSAFPSRTA